MKLKSIHVDELIYAAAKERLAAAGWNDTVWKTVREDTCRMELESLAVRE